MFKREKELMLFGLDSNEHSFEGLKLFLFIYIGASIFAAALSAPTYWAVQWLDAANSTETTRWLLGKRIDIFYDRLRWIPIIIGLPWMMGKCKLFSFRNIGLPMSSESAKTFLKFFAAGLVLSVFIFSFQYFFCNVRLEDNLSVGKVANVILSALLGGLIIGFLEELVMRCLIMRSIYTAFDALSAIILSSLFFAYKHFKVPPSIWDSLPGGVHSSSWDIGFFIAWYDTVGISTSFNFMTFFSLAMFGAVLCMLYIRTKVLWVPIAMHAGIVFSIQAYRNIFEIGKSENTVYFGNAGMTNGWMALCILSLIFICLCFWKPGGRALQAPQTAKPER